MVSKRRRTLSLFYEITETKFCRIQANKPLKQAVQLADSDTLKIILTTQDGSTASRPHQAFLSLKEPITGLETSYAFSVKESGKAKLELVSSLPESAMFEIGC